MKKLFLIIITISLLGCNQISRNNSTTNSKETDRLMEINKKGCLKALLANQIADSAIAAEFCECSINKMFELYSTEEIMRWNELSREEKIKRENIINQDCNHILEAEKPTEPENN